MLTLKGIVPVKVCDPMLAKGLGPEIGHAEAIKRTNPDTIRAESVNLVEVKAVDRLDRRALRAETKRQHKTGQQARSRARAWRA